MIKINDFKHKPSYTTLINTRLVNYLLDFLYKPLWKIINSNIKAENDNNLILDALRRGDIFYKDGIFRAVNKFSNELSIEFKKLGAKYNKNLKGFQFQEMPKFLRDFVALQEVRTQIKLEQLNGYLDDLQYNLDHYIDTMTFNHDVDKILGDVNKQIGKNVKNINVIEPELSREQLDEIGDNYTNNMKLYVKKWTSNRIVDLRQKVQQYVLEGFREEKISKLLLDEYEDELKKSIKKPKVPKSLTEFEVKKLLKLEKERIKKKAKFLAQNETSIMLAQYKKQVYTEMGFTEFKWNTIMDGRERQNHADLNGKIFRFDTPPIIDERTGQRGLPGETYNCRCGLTPIRRDSVFSNIKALNKLIQPIGFRYNHRNKVVYPIFKDLIEKISRKPKVDKISKFILNKLDRISNSNKYQKIINELYDSKNINDVVKTLKVSNTNFEYLKCKDPKFKNDIEVANDILNQIISNKINIYGTVNVKEEKKKNQSHFIQNNHTIMLKDRPNKDNICSLLHEFMHTIERDNRDVLDNSLAFLKARTINEKVKIKYKKDGKIDYRYKECGLPSTYCSRIYGFSNDYKDASCCEVLSKGFEMLLKNPKDLINKDRQYVAFIIASLQGDI